MAGKLLLLTQHMQAHTLYYNNSTVFDSYTCVAHCNHNSYIVVEPEVGESTVSGEYGDCELLPSNMDLQSDSETESIHKKQKLTSETRKLSESATYTTSYLTCLLGRQCMILSHS